MNVYPYVGAVDDPSIPPWDGTGIPLPVNDDGIPVLPDNDRLAITSPTNGSTVAPDVAISGVRAAAGATVSLFMDDQSGAVATTTAAADGTFSFDGSTPMNAGTRTFHVETSLQDSLPVTVTVVAAAATWLFMGAVPAYFFPGTDGTIQVTLVEGPTDNPAPSTGTGVLTVSEATDIIPSAQVPYDGTAATLPTASLAEGTVLDLTFDFVSDDATKWTDASATKSIPISTTAPSADVVDAGYDPSAHTVAEVQAYLADNPDQTTYVLDRERAGKNRASLV